MYWSVGGFGEILGGLESKGFLASGLSTYNFSALHYNASLFGRRGAG